MIYNNFQDIRLSALGFGAMRLPVIGGDDSRIDEAAALRMVDTAMKSGINYYDTARGYHAENSELVMGKALARYPRESFCLATKFPGYDPANWSRVEEFFETQLKKLNVEYFDFYLFHNVCEMNIDAYLDDERYHIFSYLMEQKRNGRIRHGQAGANVATLYIIHAFFENGAGIYNVATLAPGRPILSDCAIHDRGSMTAMNTLEEGKDHHGGCRVRLRPL